MYIPGQILRAINLLQLTPIPDRYLRPPGIFEDVVTGVAADNISWWKLRHLDHYSIHDLLACSSFGHVDPGQR